MKINLTEEKKKELEIWHKAERDKRIADRIKAVLLSEEGWSHKQIGQVLRIDESTVWEHLKDYREKEKLEPIGGGSERRASGRDSERSSRQD